ncbi:MAG: DUF421 domain-containing protein [Cytophagales bacterium]|nr:MAG: DUF421 domain-containing protein [Cytophagales bacterium]
MDIFFDVDWRALFVPEVALLELVIRGTLTYWFCFLYVRFFRRGAGQLGVTDLLLIILIADAAQNSMAGDYKSITEGVVLVGTLLFWNYALDWLGFNTNLFKKLVSPEPVTLVKDGQLQQHNLNAQMISQDDLNGILRENGIDDLKKVKLCQLEGTGNISVVQREGK